VAILDANEISWRVRSFVLENWGYRVAAARNSRELGALLARCTVDVVITVLPGPKERRSLARLRAGRATRWLSLDLRGSLMSRADSVMWSDATMAELRYRLGVLAWRKRGPKKKPVAEPVRTVRVA
ncbi:MAG: hypothetical protein WAM66_12300, partial [Acidobacteriaceae bacterium]